MSTSTASPQTGSPNIRWQLLGGDRFYIAARWGVFVLLVLIGWLLAQQPLWPITPSMSPILLLVWVYGLFNLAMTVALVVPTLNGLLNGAFIADILFISLFTYFSHDPRDLYYPLYLLPLVGQHSGYAHKPACWPGCLPPEPMYWPIYCRALGRIMALRQPSR